MNDGISRVQEHEWTFFWGSDDWASSEDLLLDLSNFILKLHLSSNDQLLLVTHGQYVSPSSTPQRLSKFSGNSVLSCSMFKRALFFGSCPPHQATLFSSGSLVLMNPYDETLTLAADLDAFLRLSLSTNVRVFSFDYRSVLMLNTGISSQYTFKRLRQVFSAYYKAFSFFFFFPVIFRYLKRLFSLLSL